MLTKISIYEPFNYKVTFKGVDGKEHTLNGASEGEDDEWYGFTTTNDKNEEVAFTINVFGGTSYGDSDNDINIGIYQCTTRSKDSGTGWCNDNYIGLGLGVFEVKPIK